MIKIIKLGIKKYKFGKILGIYETSEFFQFPDKTEIENSIKIQTKETETLKIIFEIQTNIKFQKLKDKWNNWMKTSEGKCWIDSIDNKKNDGEYYIVFNE